ncbi:hypothetical protein GCM10009679_23840 [Saccharothrix algeriensis]|uniref:G5 domain-containing protein n=1 Tax=Catellatospora bangladeshensis TaxID=310355 RepID=A0A8J3JJZ5_9ACTN|nr:hypothetical protein Cba03nite_07480 [Catellatospora bangladeshensis]
MGIPPGQTAAVTNLPPHGPQHTQQWYLPPTAPRRGFLASLRVGQKALLLFGGGFVAMLLACCGGLVVVGAFTDPPQDAGRPAGQAAPAAVVNSEPSPSPSAVAEAGEVTPAPSASALVEKRTVTETAAIPYSTRRVNDPNLAKGKTKVKTAGVNGVKTRTYEVTYTDGVETAKTLVSEVVTKQPVTKVILVGTKPTSSSSCDPNYAWACVPIASDVDCAGGSGNGPAYVTGPVKVIGTDIYDLDRDGDGIGCD